MSTGSTGPLTSPLHVETIGEGVPPLVLVHGFGASNHFWRKWVPGLERTHRLHLVELKGFGGAAAPPGADYSLRAQAGHLTEFLRHLGDDAPVLVGHSLGAAVILMAALRALDEGGAIRLRGLVVISGTVFPQRFPRYIGLARRRLLGELFLLATPPRPLLRMGIRSIVHDPGTVDPEQVEGYHRPLASRTRRRAILRAARQIDPALAASLVPRYREILQPLLILWGAEDRVAPPENAQRLAEATGNAEVRMLAGVGHLPPEEAPEASLDALLSFLSRLPPDSRHVGSRDPAPPGPPA